MQENRQRFTTTTPFIRLDELVANVLVPEVMPLQGEGRFDADWDLVAGTCRQGKKGQGCEKFGQWGHGMGKKWATEVAHCRSQLREITHP